VRSDLFSVGDARRGYRERDCASEWVEAGAHPKEATELIRSQLGVKLEPFDGDRIEILQLGPSVS
jgi:hypothetical protein